MSETRSEIGTLDGITEKPSGWSEINVAMPGKQYPLRLSTKIPELIELARAAGTQVMEWSYDEADSEKINEHTGKPYVNRYFKGVKPVDASAGPTATSSAVRSESSEGMTKEEWGRKDSAIHMMAAIKAAADALKHTIPSDPTSEDLTLYLERCKRLSWDWWKRADAVRAGDDSDLPFLSEHDDQIPY